MDNIPHEARKGTEDCILCICLECYQENEIMPDECEFSICNEGCFDEMGTYRENCKEFERLRGNK